MKDLSELVNTLDWDKFGYKLTFKFIQLKPNYFKMYVFDERNPENNRYLVYKYDSLCNNKSFLTALGKLKDNPNIDVLRKNLLDYLYDYGEKATQWGIQNSIKEWLEEKSFAFDAEITEDQGNLPTPQEQMLILPKSKAKIKSKPKIKVRKKHESNYNR